MAPGALIDYRIRVRGVPIRWRTEIAEWQPPFKFVDQQLKGPYRMWRHAHTFTAADGGTMVEDTVCYRPVGGALVHELFVRRDLERIFKYRQQEILAALCDMAMNAFAMESAMLRAQKMGEPETVKALLEVWLRDAMDVVAVSGRTVLAACADGDTLRTQMAALRRFTKYEPVDRIGLQRKVAARMLAAERFTIA